jgi:hypothetical protein
VSDPAEIDEEIHSFATPRLHPEGGSARENGGQTHLRELAVMSFPEQWNPVWCACFAKLSLTGSNPANLLLNKTAL